MARAIGQPLEAVVHLKEAVGTNPFDLPAARALFQALGDSGDTEAQHRPAEERRLLARAAPQRVPGEPWFAPHPSANTAPVGGRGLEADVPVSRPAAAEATPAASPQRVALCPIIKDEETNLPGCLLSAADLVDEIIVVDTGSADQTKEVARQHGAKVFDFPWVEDFAAARNECLRHATGDWIFWLDADDRLDEPNREKLRALFAGLTDENVAYVMKCRCLPDPQTGIATVVDHVRLFRNRPGVRWRYRVHEQVLPAIRATGGRVRPSEVVIEHVGYADPALRRRKQERDLRLLEQDPAEHPDEPFILFNLGWTCAELGRPAEALPLLRRSLERSHSGDSMVCKLYGIIAGCERRLGRPAQALAVCEQGKR